MIYVLVLPDLLHEISGLYSDWSIAEHSSQLHYIYV